MSLSQFNRELLTDMLYEYNKGLQKAIEQHLVLTNKLLSHKTRFHRANEQGNKIFSYKHSMYIANISGTLCMYEEYMKRKASQIKKLEIYVKQVEKAEKVREAKRLRAKQLQQAAQQNSAPQAPSDTSNDTIKGSSQACPNDCRAHPQCETNNSARPTQSRKRSSASVSPGPRPQTRSQTKRARLPDGSYTTSEPSRLDKEA